MNPRFAARFINLWPPLLFSGIRARMSADFRQIEVELRLAWWNRNVHGTLFGGSLFAMTDPFYALMLQVCLGPDYSIWDKGAEIDFVSPGKGVVRAEFRMSDETLAEIRAATANGEKHLPVFTVDVVDGSGALVARVKRTVYIRRRTQTPI